MKYFVNFSDNFSIQNFNIKDKNVDFLIFLFFVSRFSPFSYNLTKVVDKVFYLLHKLIPLRIQHKFRDIGGISYLSEFSIFLMSLGFLFTKPWIIKRFVELNSDILYQKYANGKDNILEIFKYDLSKKFSDRLLVFVHGGAWGSGSPWQYSVIADQIAKHISADSMVLVRYPVYPSSFIHEQAEAVLNALVFIYQDENIQNTLGFNPMKTKLVLCGHSSGANISALAILKYMLAKMGGKSRQNHFSDLDSIKFDEQVLSQVHIDDFIGLSGVYDIEKHYAFESARGVQDISPMGAAALGLENFKFSSPTLLLESLKKFLDENQCNASLTHLNFPKTLLIHGTKDSTVPDTSSQDFFIALNQLGIDVEAIYFEYGHIDPLLELMEFKPTQTSRALEKISRKIFE